ncbi:peptidylprolyl isomerase [Pseudochelatococcus sp. B33]
MRSVPCIVMDGVEIPEALIAAEAQHHPARSAKAAREAAARALAARALLLARARELGLSPIPERDDEGREETAEEALIRAVLSREVEVEPADSAACLRFYEAHRDSFRAPDLYDAAHILFAPDRDADDAHGALHDARLRAEAALQRLAREPEAFADIARDASDCPTGKAGGHLGQMQTGDLDQAVEAVLAALDEGEIAPVPVRSRYGWHILRLDRRVRGAVLPFAHVHETIRLHLDSRAWVRAAGRYARELADRAQGKGIVASLTDEGAVAKPTLTLGQVLGADAATLTRFEAWLAGADPDLLARARSLAQAEGADVAGFVQREARAFVAGAGDEAWTSLISAARNGSDPVLAALRFMLRSKLVPPRRTRTVIRTT